MLVLFVVSVIFTESAVTSPPRSGAEPITIQADGQQWVWRYEYPEATDTSDGYSAETPFSFYELVVPVGTPVTLDVSSVDVLHRWWVPALGRAVDAVPGKSNEFTFVADELGDYEGRSTAFSGPGYPTMRTVVRVVAAEEYEAFLEERIAGMTRRATRSRTPSRAGPPPGWRSRNEPPVPIHRRRRPARGRQRGHPRGRPAWIERITSAIKGRRADVHRHIALLRRDRPTELVMMRIQLAVPEKR